MAHIELGITINGSRKFITMPFICDWKEFNRKRKPQYIQDYIDSQRINISKIVTELATNNIPLTAETLRKYIRVGGVMSYTIANLFDDYMRMLSKRVGTSLTQASYDKYLTVRKLFETNVDFSQPCTAITPAVVQDFYAGLRAKYEDSTSCGMMTKLKTVIRYGMDNGKIKINPFQGIKIKKGIKDVQTITMSQLNMIKNMGYVPSLQKVADLFVFACGSGMAFCDCIRLKPEDFVERDGHMCVIKERHKTGVMFYAVLLPWAVDIWRKYNGDFSHIIMSPQKTNQYLKTIQDVCGIGIKLHFHLARHFYSMYLLNKKVPITSVSKAIGHSNINITQHYAKALISTVVDDISKVI